MLVTPGSERVKTVLSECADKVIFSNTYWVDVEDEATV